MKGGTVRGFTLVEVAVAIAILSVLMAVLYLGYGLGVRTWERGERINAAVSELRLAGRFIRNRVQQAYPLPVTVGGGTRLRFEGEAQRLAFVTWVPRYLGEGGLHELVLAVDVREVGVDLSVSRRPLAADKPGGAEVVRQRRLLVRDLESVRFDYFGSPVDGVQPVWHPRWHARQRLPRLVRLRLSSRHVGDWPAIVIPVHSEPATERRAAAPRASTRGGAPAVAAWMRAEPTR